MELENAWETRHGDEFERWSDGETPRDAVVPRRPMTPHREPDRGEDGDQIDLASLPEIIGCERPSPSDLIPILQRVQHACGYLPEPVVDEIARLTGIPASRIYGVVTFYAQFSTVPSGRHKVCVCQGTACHVRGGDEVLRAVRKDLSIAPGETTPDLDFTLDTVACLGACSFAPVMTVDGQYFGKMKGSRVAPILDESRSASREEGTA
ncbi:MAG: NAD(P)H-dependent oxidoreductase subunit E [Thermoleophilia bacterium]